MWPRQQGEIRDSCFEVLLRHELREFSRMLRSSACVGTLVESSPSDECLSRTTSPTCRVQPALARCCARGRARSDGIVPAECRFTVALRSPIRLVLALLFVWV